MKSLQDYSVEYSTVRCFSDSNKWCVLLHNFQTFDLFDENLNFNRHLKINAHQEPRWYGELLYCIVGRSLVLFNFDLNSINVVYEFTEYVDYVGDIPGVQGLGEGDIENGKIALAGLREDGTRDIFLFNLDTYTKGNVLNLEKDGELTTKHSGRAHGFDNIYATPDGNVIVSWYASGIERFNGVELFDGDMNFIKQLTTVNSHMDVSPFGLVWCSSPDPVINSNSAILMNEQKFKLFTAVWDYAMHISCCERCCVISLNDPVGKLAFGCLVFDYDGKLLKTLDSYFGPYKDYNSAQKASISKDGSKIVRCRFDGQSYYADIFGLEEQKVEEYPGFREITDVVKKRYLIELNPDGRYREFEKI